MKNRICYVLILIIILISAEILPAQTFQWALGTGGTDSDVGSGVAVDNFGNTFYTGTFNGTADLNPGPGTFNLTSVNIFEDIFIVKLDSLSNFVWAKKIGASGYDKSESIAVDNNGNIFVTGLFNGSGDFDPGPGVFNMTSVSANNADIFILKLDFNGDFVWAKQIGSIGDDSGKYVSLDAFGNVYLTGHFNYSADFDPGPGAYILSSAGDADIFVLKLDSNGQFIYALRFGGPLTDKGIEVIVSPSGNVFTTGHFAGTADFDPGPGVYNLTYVGLYDIFVMKTTVAGHLAWARAMGGADYDFGYSINVDSYENVYTTGEIRGTVDLDPGPGVHNIIPIGSGKNIFISKLDSSGIFIFGKAFLGNAYHENFALAIAVDQSNNVLLSGQFRGVVDFDPSTGVFNLTSTGSDLFISKLDQNGDLIFVRRANGVGYNGFTAMCFDISGNLYLTGAFQNTLNTNPPTSSTLTSAGDYDILFMKYSACSVTSSSQIISNCNTYLSPSGNFTWTTSGNYVDTIYSVGGCDSIININLTILPFTEPVIVGDTLICQGELSTLTLSASYATYTWSNGSTASSTSVGSTGNYTVTVTSSNGCSGSDSFHLTVSNPIVNVFPMGTTTFCQGDSVMLAATSGFSSYQWYRRNYAIPGATSSNFVAKIGGQYKCIAQNVSTCIDTSNIVVVNVPCIPIEPSIDRTISFQYNEFPYMNLFPNPGMGLFSLQSTPGHIQVFNASGVLILSKEISDKETIIDISNNPDGMYFVKLYTGSTIISQKILLAH